VISGFIAMASNEKRKIESLLSEFESLLQGVKVLYLRMLNNYHLSKYNISNKKHRNKRWLREKILGSNLNGLESHNGWAFLAFIEGYVTIQGGIGKINYTPFSLTKKDEEIKEEFVRRLNELQELIREYAKELLRKGKYKKSKEIITEFLLVKFMVHEYYLTDEHKENSAGDEKLKDKIIAQMWAGVRPKDISLSRKALSGFISRHLNWRRYAMCAFDCGPIFKRKNPNELVYPRLCMDIRRVAKKGYSKDDMRSILQKYFKIELGGYKEEFEKSWHLDEEKLGKKLKRIDKSYF
jgi:hypothetical protein